MKSLKVFLGKRRVGTVSLLPGELTLFAFDEDYYADPNRPVLSQSYLTKSGQLRQDTRPTKTRLPPWFSNLLPEGRLRDYLASTAKVNPRREYPLLAILGADLPGAVTVEAEEDASAEENVIREDQGPLRFSLAGVQLKFSALLDRRGGLTIPASGMGGNWIVKLPSPNYPAVPENEAAMLSLAQSVGIEVPEHRLILVDEIRGLPPLRPFSGKKALALRRFDRGDSGPVHMEDFAQVFGVFPEEKYEKVGYARIAEMIGIVLGGAAAQDFVARLSFAVATGNGDMHLKNWSLLYPDETTPQLSPAYDLVSTIAYLPEDRLALNFAGEKDFDRIGLERFQRLAENAALPRRETTATAKRIFEAVAENWPAIRRKSEVPTEIAKKIDAHIRGIATKAAK
ncbi:MAG TPA: HipA domain-containing protein [Chthoniobacteraceae bacterium]|jgi:serine/threonine-protein kinase HipA